MSDVHSLAAELGVSTDIVLRTATEVAGPPASQFRLAPEVADAVRERIRAAGRGQSSLGGPMFSGTVERAEGARQARQVIAPAFASPRATAPAATGASAPPRVATVPPVTRPDQSGLAAALAEAEARAAAPAVAAFDTSELRAAQEAEALEFKAWHDAGLGVHDRYIIDQCLRNGLSPDDLRRRSDGRTIASRLKNGESISSVLSRLDQMN